MRETGGKDEVRRIIDAGRAAGRRVGLVPTMGYLHEGHLSLVDRARRECDFVVLSIFVNPTQFGPGEDLDRYPRDLDRDRALARERGVDLLFAPSPEEMYPPGHATWVVVEGLTEGLCGAARPGHFRGVTTVVAKLFGICRPHRAYFGQKDAQQALVIRRMAADLDTGIEVVVCPIVREEDGLALSSRNVYLSPDERPQAPALYRGLRRAEELAAAGERDARRLVAVVREVIAAEPEARVEYVEAVATGDLRPVEDLDQETLLAVAVRFGATRLIDNVILRPRPNARPGR